MSEAKLILCYNTNGFYHHSLEEATRIIADLGYKGVALTPDVHHLNPLVSTLRDLDTYRTLLEQLGLRVVVETGARYVMDPMKKHHPSLLTPGRGRERLRFLKSCVEMAGELGAPIVSFHSGTAEGVASRERDLDTLAGFTDELLQICEGRGLCLALEPEPGMLIEAMADYEALKDRCRNKHLRLTLDTGHVHITENATMSEVISCFAPDLVNVHLDDAANGKHEHLPPGTGEILFSPAMEALKEMGRELFLSVELSRHGHEAVKQAEAAFSFFSSML
ncbi:MAG: sugar phosphate isomerase/epimerase [Planctomycetota bacterium]